MQNIEWILSMAGTVLGLLITTVTFITKFLKSAKAKRTAENILKICNAVVPYIEQAESFLHYTGAEKKEFVMTKANQFAIDNKISFNSQQISEKIEELVSLTKQVNSREEKNNQINFEPAVTYTSAQPKIILSKINNEKGTE